MGKIVKTFYGLIFLAFFALPAAVGAHSEHSAKTADKRQSAKKNVSNEANVGECIIKGGGRALENISQIHQGKTYYFCCQSCIETFKKDPQKYLSQAKTIKIEAHKFAYEPNIVRVKKGDNIILELTSRDVTHGFYLKGYNIDVSVKKGEIKSINFIADKAGEFLIKCSVFCGSGHFGMKGKLVVE